MEGNIGNVYLDQWEHSKALNYFFKSLTLAREPDSKKGELTPTANIGTVYFLQGAYEWPTSPPVQDKPGFCLKYPSNTHLAEVHNL